MSIYIYRFKSEYLIAEMFVRKEINNINAAECK